MTSIRKLNLRSLGGLAGVLVAVAGGLGAAVGMYTLPDPTTVAIDAHVYARADQRAIAVWKGPPALDGSFTGVRIEATRGGSAGIGDGSPSPNNPDVNAYFRATRETCASQQEFEAGACPLQDAWNGAFALSTFVFDPLMGSATFSGDVEGCQFDVQWTGQGLIAPVAGHSVNTQVVPGTPDPEDNWNVDLRVDAAYGEISRVAPASITAACLGFTTQPAPGFLSQGLRRSIGHVHVFENPPPPPPG